nr:hypothetical protein [uncultured Cohaesibacter sp.]
MYKPIVKVIEVPTDAMSAYKRFTMDMGMWWPLDTRSISIHSTGVPAKRLETDPVAGGAIIEVSADDTRHVWASFADCDAPRSVAIIFHMGQPLEYATRLVVSFIETHPHQTLVKLVHGGWKTYGPLAPMMRKGYDAGWDEIFCLHYARACEKTRYLKRA